MVLTSRTESGYHHAIAGAISGCLTRFIVQPLDVVKIRFQLQVEPIKNNAASKYHSLSQSVNLIVKEEGILALWKGHVPAQALSVVYGTNQFYVYNIVSKYLKEFDFLNNKPNTNHFISGSIAGCAATISSFPMDTVRTRLIAQSDQNKVYRGTIHSCISIYKSESPKGFFRGLFPTLLQIAPYAGLQFATYELVKDVQFLPKNVNEADGRYQVNVINSLVAGCVAGLVAKTVVYPLDLIRKRLQIQGFQHSRKGFGKVFYCDGMINCLCLTVKNEGYKGLFKGIGPSQCKAALMTALNFTFYEQILIIIQNNYKKEF